MRRNIQTGSVASFVFLGVALVGIGGTLYYFFVLGPQRERDQMQAEIAAWGVRWEAMKTCLLGDERQATSAAEQLAIREIYEAGSSRFTESCASPLDELVRNASYSTGDVVVDKRWREVEDRVKRFKSPLRAFIGGIDDPHTRRTRLGEAIDSLDATYAALRAAAELAPRPAPATAIVEVPPLPEAVPLDVSMPLLGVSANAGTVVFSSGIPGGTREAHAKSPTDITSVDLRDDVVRARGADWGLVVDRAGWIRAAKVDATGKAVGSGAVVAKHAAPGFIEADALHPRYAVGTGKHRVAVYEREYYDFRSYWMQLSHDGGRTWRSAWRIRYDENSNVEYHANRVLGHVHLTYDYDGQLEWFPITPKTAEKLIPRKLRRVPQNMAANASQMCFGPTKAWITTADATIRTSHHGADPPDLMSWTIDSKWNDLVCDDETVADVTAGALVECRPGGGCSERIPFATDGSAWAAVDSGHDLVVASLVDDKLVLWRLEGDRKRRAAPAGVFRMRDGVRIQALVDWGGALHAIAIEGDQVVAIPLPAQTS